MDDCTHKEVHNGKEGMAMMKLGTEWLVEELQKQYNIQIDLKNTIAYNTAMQMERRNIEIAWHDGSMLGRNGWVLEEYGTAKEYVQRSYEKGNK